jgi:hypothetical protein
MHLCQSVYKEIGVLLGRGVYVKLRLLVIGKYIVCYTCMTFPMSVVWQDRKNKEWNEMNFSTKNEWDMVRGQNLLLKQCSCLRVRSGHHSLQARHQIQWKLLLRWVTNENCVCQVIPTEPESRGLSAFTCCRVGHGGKCTQATTKSPLYYLKKTIHNKVQSLDAQTLPLPLPPSCALSTYAPCIMGIKVLLTQTTDFRILHLFVAVLHFHVMYNFPLEL